jgi:hypothetical protein
MQWISDMQKVGLCAVGAVSHSHRVLASLHNQLCGKWDCAHWDMLAIHTGSLQACIISYSGVGQCVLGAASHPHGVLASLHNQICGE